MTVQFELGATIPIGPYANAQPRITTSGADFISARDEAFREMGQIVAALNPDLAFNAPETANTAPRLPSTATKQVCVASGTEVMFDPVTHTYGPGWTGGSTFAKRFGKGFPRDIIAQASGRKHGLPAQDFIDRWQLSSDIATSMGSALHSALEAYGRFKDMDVAVKGEVQWPSSPELKKAVQLFYESHTERAQFEAFVADPDSRLCGFIYRLEILGDKHFRVTDYKTGDIHKADKVAAPFAGKVPDTKLGLYVIQLSAYSYILQTHGWLMEPVKIYHWDGSEWTDYEHEVVDVSEGI